MIKTTTLRTYEVRITNTETGKTDTQTVRAADEWKARTVAMMQTNLRLQGARADYVVTEL